jgi:hypothetical protein
MSRNELAEAVCAWLWQTTNSRYDLDGHSIARMERGGVRWPRAPYRSGLRHVLGAVSDRDLGFQPAQRGDTVPVRSDDALSVSAPAHREQAVGVLGFRAMSQAFQLADRQVGGGELYRTVIRYLKIDVAPRLLDAGETDSAAVFAAAGSLTEIAGWMAHDMGQDGRAHRHFDKAFRLASAAGHDALAGNVCASMAHLAGQVGQATDAVRMAEAGLTRARRATGTRQLSARLHAMRARGLSAQGDQHACAVALLDAERILDTAPNEPSAEWVTQFDDAALAAEAALCLRKLGQLSQAEQQARRVIELRGGDRVRSRAFGQLILARVLVDGGRPEEAALVGQQICEVASSLTSNRVQTRLDRLGHALKPYQVLPEVGAFLSDLAELRVPENEPPADGGTSWPV